MQRQPNTLDCHRLIRWAGEQGKAPQMKQRLMDLYFTEGGDLSHREVLVQAAADCGLDADEVRRKLATEEDVDSVTQAADQAKQAGIEGVPTYILGGRYAISGAQAPELLAKAIKQIAQELQAPAAE
jgi:predicted DsbA family dithiol-disulfide isomerase